MPKRSPEDVLRDIEESDADDAIDRALAMTPEERRKELEAAGFDVKELHAKADEWHARVTGAPDTTAATHVGSQPSRKPAGTRSGRGRVVLLVSAAAVAAILLALLLFPRLARKEPDVATPPPNGQK